MYFGIAYRDKDVGAGASESYLQIGVITPVLQNRCGLTLPTFVPLCPALPDPVDRVCALAGCTL
ncbi:MAG: hypothetical protein WA364_20420 [Candidatus Nitrosopolaris sp.]